MRKKISVKGLPCPYPVLATRKELEIEEVQVLEVTVDSEISKENIVRLCQELNYQCSSQKDGDDFILTIDKAGAITPPSTPPKNKQSNRVSIPNSYVVYFSDSVVGQGDPSLGDILLTSFLKTLLETNPLPTKILFVNKGVFITTEGSKVIPVLLEFERKGVVLLSCGTCLDFYHCKDKLLVGKVTNMFEIVESLRLAGKIIQP